MRSIRGCPGNFRDSLTTSTATIPKIFHGHLFRSTLNVPTKFEVVALPVPEIIGVPEKMGNGQPLDTPTLHFLQNL